ncbi:unnamed protein product [Prunus brigantina]
MRVINHLLSPSKRSEQIGIGISSHLISLGFAASPFRVVQNRVYLHDLERFSHGSSSCLIYVPYEIFKYSEDDTLPLYVYHRIYCGFLVTVHYIRSSDFLDMQKWLSL